MKLMIPLIWGVTFQDYLQNLNSKLNLKKIDPL